MKPNHNHKKDEHIALGMMAAYAAGMLVMGIFFGLGTLNRPEATTSQASGQSCPPEGATPDEVAWYLNTGQCE